LHELENFEKTEYKSDYARMDACLSEAGCNGMSNQPRNLSELMAAAGIVPIGGSSISGVILSSLTDDSRKVGPGACFVAVPGTRQDGARFIDQARLNGASVIIGGPDIPNSTGLPQFKSPIHNDPFAPGRGISRAP
jgi:hypothetical protein